MFHNRAAATGNARSLRLDHLVAGTNRVDVSQIVDDDMPRCRTSGAVSRRGTVGHYRANSVRQGHTNGTEYAL